MRYPSRTETKQYERGIPRSAHATKPALAFVFDGERRLASRGYFADFDGAGLGPYFWVQSATLSLLIAS